jgi:hypothetical protein
MLGAPTSLASTMMTGPHHAAVIHAGDSSEVGQREHMVRQVFTRKCWSEFLCLGGYPASPRQVRGFVPRDALGRHPSADPAAGAPPAGPWQEPNWVYSYVNHPTASGDAVPTWLTIISQVLCFGSQVTSLTRCPRFGYRPRCKREAFAESHVGRLTVRVRKRRSKECLFESEGP